ncbi:hypothetical protein CLOM_g8166 [Closterium sp. NIES-68]|nr:hypothetical protein CLOM_g8166 [Closterium sp. NIES-68]GJP69644.1 hypothetical protein CLOP_g632 [Closterium sp. NIES-67]
MVASAFISNRRRVSQPTVAAFVVHLPQFVSYALQGSLLAVFFVIGSVLSWNQLVPQSYVKPFAVWGDVSEGTRLAVPVLEDLGVDARGVNRCVVDLPEFTRVAEVAGNATQWPSLAVGEALGGRTEHAGRLEPGGRTAEERVVESEGETMRERERGLARETPRERELAREGDAAESLAGGAERIATNGSGGEGQIGRGSEGKEESQGGGALSTSSGGEALSTSSGGEALSTRSGGEALSTSSGGEALSTRSGGEALSTSSGGEALSTSSGGQALSTSSGGEALSTSSGGEALSTSSGGEALSTSSRSSDRTLGIYEAWASAYGLATDSPYPPSASPLSAGLPPAPHLDDCRARSAFRQAMEMRGRMGEAPRWAEKAAEECEGVPQPPWVRGSEAGSLGGTRAAQRDLWEHQFPPHHCRGRRLLLVQWPALPPTLNRSRGAQREEGKGVGQGVGEWLAQAVEAMGAALAVAVSSGRVLVPLGGSFGPARHEACRVHGAWGEWHCYFHRLASPHCDVAVHSALRHTQGGEGAQGGEEAARLWRPLAEMQGEIASEARVVRVVAEVVGGPGEMGEDGEGGCDGSSGGAVGRGGRHPAEEAAALMGHAWQHVAVGEGAEGSACSDRRKKVQWWRAQSARFMLRWPSLYLCHVINRQRHSAYGRQVARSGATREAEADAILSSLLLPLPRARDASADVNEREEGRELAGFNFSAPNTAETGVWPFRGFQGCVARGRGNVMTAQRSAMGDYRGVGGEVYVFRPIVSMHVGRGGGGGGMAEGRQVEQGSADEERAEEETRGDEQEKRAELAVLGAVLHAYGFRQQQPDLKHVWLTAHSKAIMRHVAGFHDWKFLYSRHLLGNHTREGSSQSASACMAGVVGAQLASVLIAAESDYFVGSLASQCSRLILTLKTTNGRLAAPAVLLK